VDLDEFVRRVRDREQLIGYWVVLDSPVSTERASRVGYDYVCLDGQHGLLGYAGWLSGLMAIDAGASAAGLVRVPSNDVAWIGQALDAGAAGVIVPLVDTPEDAARAVAACRYAGGRSYGPMRAGLRIGPRPAQSDATVLCFVMIETRSGLDNVEEIARVPGVDGLYIGPSDLTLAIGGAYPGDPDVHEALEDAHGRIREAAERAGIAAGVHTPHGELAAQRLREGFTFVTVSSDLTHLEQAARSHLETAHAARTHA
jgi:4-hydroxy-2-oxoheptanedioate aldolase